MEKGQPVFAELLSIGNPLLGLGEGSLLSFLGLPEELLRGDLDGGRGLVLDLEKKRRGKKEK